jgi:hypothetical protein
MNRDDIPIRSESSDFDAGRLRQLAAAQCDECLTDAEAGELEAMLSASAAARTMYVRYMNVHAGLDWEITSRESVEEMVPAVQASRENLPPAAAGRSWPWALAAIAAGLLIVSSVAVWQSKEKSPHGQSPIADAAPIENGDVAAVTQLGPEAKWSVARRDNAAPKQLRVNDVVSISEGEMQVRFESGVVVTLYAPAELEVISPMMGRAIRGRLSANVVDGAEGFAIVTPRATVIDQGTVFGVEVGDKGDTDVVVFKGTVDLHLDALAGVRPAPAPTRLTTGEAMRIDNRGTTSRIVSISSDRFGNRPDYHAPKVDRPVLISAVNDNIERDANSWNYYEIVHGGMQEDARAFVDRDEHEWNGIDAAGMPKFLIGGDYVKTFNNDKFGRDIELFVTVEHSCKLYVLLDDRITPPAWLLNRFHDTGFDVGMDVGRFYRLWDGKLMEDRLPGVGPGVSVDDTISIWECDVRASEIVHLGATEAVHRFVNMYGIVAVPLEQK